MSNNKKEFNLSKIKKRVTKVVAIRKQKERIAYFEAHKWD